MCQLTLVDLKSAKQNRIAMWLQFYQNTVTTNKDGFGIYNGELLSKSEHDVQKISNFGQYFTDLIYNKNPVIGHVRFATVHNSKKEISNETSHPFEGDKIVLAHNGVLEYKIKNDRFKDITVDSLVFLKEFELIYDGTNFVEALQKTVDLFHGTFAFLIYSKLEKKYFIIRGKTKKLYVSKVNSGLIINTSNTDLEIALNKLKALCKLVGLAEISYTNADELKEETIYELQSKENESLLVEIGKVKETSAPVTKYQQGVIVATANVKSEMCNLITEFLEANQLSIFELDYGLQEIYNYPFFSATKADIITFIRIYNKKINPMNTDAKKKIWAEIRKFYENPMEIYFTREIKFPYAMNSKSKLQEILDDLRSTFLN